MNIIIFKGKSLNNTLEYFADGIAGGFEKLGHNVYFIDMKKTVNAMNIYSGVKALNADFTFSFNIIYPNIFKDNEIFDKLKIPHFAFPESAAPHLQQRLFVKRHFHIGCICTTGSHANR